jgi:hypothetical protein
MPSKGGSRQSQGRTSSAAVGPAATVLQAVVGSAQAVAMEATSPVGNLDAVSVGPLVDDDPPVDSPAWVELYASALAQYREQREQTEREQEQAQQLWDEFLRLQGQDIPEGERSLVANEALHRELKRLAMTAEAASYERENVIGDPNQTFGIEIEFDGANPNAVARALHEAGLASSARQEPYHSTSRVPGKWTVEHDATVAGEVVSPILQDTPETWAQLERVCQILQEQGARASGRTGGHVHVGVDSAGMDHDVNKFRRVARVCAWAEDLMYRLAAATGHVDAVTAEAPTAIAGAAPWARDNLRKCKASATWPTGSAAVTRSVSTSATSSNATGPSSTAISTRAWIPLACKRTSSWPAGSPSVRRNYPTPRFRENGHRWGVIGAHAIPTMATGCCDASPTSSLSARRTS